ncbi:peptidase C39 family protein [Francisella philomiragia]|uniref:peptidase C39 family protein n=1 Tax=Francisella philomiragia TaxID=28110 RepID=UPI0005A5662A|nr:peptidase C39 family protein [Francisella philomiragia]AJI54606.1 peptidase C39 family protein [Francisella philomiragia]MBK2253271.1 peptidase C39 family protein [Francisella philomiragia]
MSKRVIFILLTLIFTMSLSYSSGEYANKTYIENVVKTFDLSTDKNIKILDIKDHQQTTDYTCGPSAVMSLLNYYGVLKDSQMDHQMELQIAKEMGTNDDYGTTAQQIANWLEKHGFEVKYATDGDIKLIYQSIDKGVPVLVDWIDWGGHWTLVSGYQKLGKTIDDDKDTLFMIDPAAHFNNVKTVYGLSAINPDRFQYMWQDSKGVKGIYVIAQPKK